MWHTFCTFLQQSPKAGARTQKWHCCSGPEDGIRKREEAGSSLRLERQALHEERPEESGEKAFGHFCRWQASRGVNLSTVKADWRSFSRKRSPARLFYYACIVFVQVHHKATLHQGMQKYLRDSIFRNKSYDRMVGELLSATGTTAPGVEISEHMPQTTKVMQHLACMKRPPSSGWANSAARHESTATRAATASYEAMSEVLRIRLPFRRNVTNF